MEKSKLYYNPNNGFVGSEPPNEQFYIELTEDHYPVFNWHGKYVGVVRGEIFIKYGD